MKRLKEVLITITTAGPAQVITRGRQGARDVSTFENNGGKFEYTETMIVPEDAIIIVEDVE